MRRILCWLIVLALACPAALAYGFVDSAGVQLEVEKPQRVAVLFASLAEMWRDAGGEISVTVGESINRGFAPEGTPLVDAATGKTINAELLIAQRPDFVICSADTPAQAELAVLLNAAGIPCAQFRVDSFQDYLAVLEIMCGVTGDAAAYAACGTAVQAEIEALLASEAASAAKGMRVLFVRAGGTARFTKAKGSADNFACAMLAELGCVNVADAAPALLEGLSMEAILMADPDWVLFSMLGDEAAARANIEAMLKTPAWAQLTAVQAGRVAILPKELFHYKPNARWAEAYAYLVDLFAEVE